MRNAFLLVGLAITLMLMSCDEKGSSSRESGELTVSDSMSTEKRQAALEEELLNDPTWVDPGLRTGITPQLI